MLNPLISLHTFKAIRKEQGTPYAFFQTLMKAGFTDSTIERLWDGSVAHYSFRMLEKAKSKEIYDLLAGFYEGYTTPLPTMKAVKTSSKT